MRFDILDGSQVVFKSGSKITACPIKIDIDTHQAFAGDKKITEVLKEADWFEVFDKNGKKISQSFVLWIGSQK